MERVLGQLDAEVRIDPADAEPRNIYKLLIGSVVPRPIALVSSISVAGVRNLAPFSFFTVASANPPVVCFCPMISGAGNAKDTLNNIRATRQFVVNIVSEEFVGKMNQCSAEYPPDADEFTESGLTPLKSDLVRPDRVSESQVQMECELLQIVDVSSLPLGGSMVLGQVKLFHIADQLFQNFSLDPRKLHPVGRMAGATYTRTTDLFDLPRP
jgi:flavin reductase (DIM6/NTAB) family NADH-FMN oxidoreductase RutF